MKHPYCVKSDETDSETDIDMDYYKNQLETENDVLRHKPTPSMKDKYTKDRCSVCSKQFRNRKFLTQHELTHRESSQTCCRCGKKFKSCTRLKAHRLVCTGVIEPSPERRLSHNDPLLPSSPG